LHAKIQPVAGASVNERLNKIAKSLFPSAGDTIRQEKLAVDPYTGRGC
jgi:hypothetical protein